MTCRKCKYECVYLCKHRYRLHINANLGFVGFVLVLGLSMEHVGTIAIDMKRSLVSMPGIRKLSLVPSWKDTCM
jgi:hypothetical protein